MTIADEQARICSKVEGFVHGFVAARRGRVGEGLPVRLEAARFVIERWAFFDIEESVIDSLGDALREMYIYPLKYIDVVLTSDPK